MARVVNGLAVFSAEFVLTLATTQNACTVVHTVKVPQVGVLKTCGVLISVAFH
jgi:hypothetical protein